MTAPESPLSGSRAGAAAGPGSRAGAVDCGAAIAPGARVAGGGAS